MKKMFISLIAVLPLFLSSETWAEDKVIDEMEAWIKNERPLRKIPAVGFALVRKGEVSHVSGYGLAEIEADRAATGTTLFRVGSVSKPVTATALLQVFEKQGRNLHDDVRSEFSDLAFRPPLKKEMTAHNLLTHTCGLNERLFGQHTATRDEFETLEAFLLNHLPPRFEDAGRIISYNDYCTSLAGLLIERLSKKGFHDYVTDNVFAPLGMASSDFNQLWEDAPRRHSVAVSYRWQGGRHEPYARDYIMTTPAAGLWTTPEDMGRYLEFLLSDGGEVLSASSLEKQRNVQFTHNELTSGRSYGFASMTFRGHTVFYKDGQASGFSARLVMVPETGDGFFIVQSRSIFDALGAINPAGRFNRELTMIFLEELFPETIKTDEPAIPVNPGNDVSRYEGSYRNVVAARHTYEKTISLMDDVIVRSPEPGILQYGSQKFVSKEGGVFQWHEGGPFHIVFDDTDSPHYLFIGGGAYERIPPLMNSRNAPLLLAGLLGISFLVLLLTVRPAFLTNQTQTYARVLATSSALKLAGVVGIGLSFWLIDLQEFFSGVPAPLLVALLLPPMGFVLDLWIVVAWQRMRVFTRILATLHLLAAVGLALWLEYWNLLGWKLG